MSSMSRGQMCACGNGRGFRTKRLAQATHQKMTSHLEVEHLPDFYHCSAGAWHWGAKETP